VVSFGDQGIVPVDLEEEVARLRQEKEQLGQELAGAREAGRLAGEELGHRNRELSGNNRATPLFYLAAQRSFHCSRTDLLLGL